MTAAPMGAVWAAHLAGDGGGYSKVRAKRSRPRASWPSGPFRALLPPVVSVRDVVGRIRECHAAASTIQELRHILGLRGIAAHLGRSRAD